jgi:hypothetical protein
LLLDVFVIFFYFCCLHGMEFGVLFFVECWCPYQKLMVERCFLDLLWLCDENEARLLNGGRMHLVKGGDIYLTRITTKDFGFLTQIHLNFVLWF